MWNVLTEEQSWMDYVVFMIRHHFLLEDGIMFLMIHMEDVKGHCAVLARAVCLVGICTEASFWEWQGKQVYFWCWRWIWVMDSWVGKGRIRKSFFLRNVRSLNVVEGTQKASRTEFRHLFSFHIWPSYKTHEVYFIKKFYSISYSIVQPTQQV